MFIAEINAIGQKRNSGNMGGNNEREQTMNQLLTEMDGFEGNTGVIILAATDRAKIIRVSSMRISLNCHFAWYCEESMLSMFPEVFPSGPVQSRR